MIEITMGSMAILGTVDAVSISTPGGAPRNGFSERKDSMKTKIV